MIMLRGQFSYHQISWFPRLRPDVQNIMGHIRSNESITKNKEELTISYASQLESFSREPLPVKHSSSVAQDVE